MKAPFILATVVAALAAAAPASFAAQSTGGYRLITDTLGGNGHAKQSQAHGNGFITDTLGGNGRARQLHAHGERFITDTLGGNGQATHRPANDDYFITDTLSGNGGTAVAVPNTDAGFQWSDAGIGAAVSAGSILVLIGGSLVLLRRRGQLPV